MPECDREASVMMKALPTMGCCAMKENEGINTVNTFSYFLNVYVMVRERRVTKACPKSNIIMYTKT